MASRGRIIFHIDMNSFYASVEMAHDPSLKGKPLAIAGDPEERRGIIVTCSYEARRFGVKTTMPVWEAKKLCPNLIIKRPNFDRYRAMSRKIFAILREYSDLVEPASIDEGYMDVTDNCHDHPVKLAHHIQQRILHELDLPCSIGIGPNKFLAKTASDMKKPLGITILRKRDLPNKLWPLPVEEMYGIGKKTASKLRQLGIQTIGDLARGNDIQLRAVLGINGIRLKEWANGHDTRPVDPEAIYEYKSIGNSTTLAKDTADRTFLLNTLHSLARTVSARLHNKEVFARTVAITIRYSDRKTITRSQKVINPVHDLDDLYRISKELFSKHWNGKPVRLLGITGQDLIEKDQAFEQLDLFTYEEYVEEENLLEIVEVLKDKYGDDIIKKGIKKYRPEGQTDTGFNKDFLLRK